MDTHTRAADTDTLADATIVPGWLPISLGIGDLEPDDHTLPTRGMAVYDALYAGCKSPQDRHDRAAAGA